MRMNITEYNAAFQESVSAEFQFLFPVSGLSAVLNQAYSTQSVFFVLLHVVIMILIKERRHSTIRRLKKKDK